MLDYGTFSSFAPAWDSSGSTDGGYFRAAQRAQGREKLKQWEKGLMPSDRVGVVPETREFVLSQEEKDTLKGIKVELDGFVEGVKGGGEGLGYPEEELGVVGEITRSSGGEGEEGS